MSPLSREVAIRDLTPRMAVAWTLKARVVSRTPTRAMRDSTQSSFSVTLVDRNGDEIRAVVYNGAVDIFGSILAAGKVYGFANCSLRTAKRTVSTSVHRYEIAINNDADISEADDDARIPQTSYHFARLSDIAKAPAGSFVDVIGVVSSVGAIEEITGRDGNTYSRRNMTLASEENLHIECTLWGELAKRQMSTRLSCVVALTNCRVTTFSGRSLTSTVTTTIDEEPFDPAADKLYEWMATRTALRTLHVSLFACRLTELRSLHGLADGALVDVLGVVEHAGNLVSMTTREGKPCAKRVLQLVDDKGGMTPCTVWNQHAQEDCASWIGHSLVIKGGRVKDGNGRSVHCIPTAYLVLDPPMDEAARIESWYRKREDELDGSEPAFGSGATDDEESKVGDSA